MGYNPRRDSIRVLRSVDSVGTWRSVTALVLLAGLGLVTGAGLGVALLAGLALMVDGRGGFPHVLDAFAFAGVVGGFLGLALFPAAVWGGLRHIAIGRILLVTARGTAIGCGAGAGAFLLLSAGNALLMAATAVIGGIAGFAVAVLYLKKSFQP